MFKIIMIYFGSRGGGSWGSKPSSFMLWSIGRVRIVRSGIGFEGGPNQKPVQNQCRITTEPRPTHHTAWARGGARPRPIDHSKQELLCDPLVPPPRLQK